MISPFFLVNHAHYHYWFDFTTTTIVVKVYKTSIPRHAQTCQYSLVTASYRKRCALVFTIELGRTYGSFRCSGHGNIRVVLTHAGR